MSTFSLRPLENMITRRPFIPAHVTGSTENLRYVNIITISFSFLEFYSETWFKMFFRNAGLKYQLYQLMCIDNALKEKHCKRVPYTNEKTAWVSNNTK